MKISLIALSNKVERNVYVGKKYSLETHALLISRSTFTKSSKKLELLSEVIFINEIKIENIKNILIIESEKYLPYTK